MESVREKEDYVYVVYRAADRPRIETWIKLLRDAGVRVWVDRDEIQGGENWEQVTRNAVADAEAILIFVSEDMGEGYHWAEIKYALGHAERLRAPHRFILPLKLDRASDLPADLAHIQSIELYGASPPAAVEQVVAALPPAVLSSAPVEEPKTSNKGYMFLSYASEDAEFVHRLKLFLKDRGYAYWDFRESDRDYHVALSIELEEAIMGSAAMACVLSPDWKKSKWALRELFFADDAGLPYLLLLARSMGPTLATAGMTFIDFESDADRGYEQLDRDLQRKGL